MKPLNFLSALVATMLCLAGETTILAQTNGTPKASPKTSSTNELGTALDTVTAQLKDKFDTGKTSAADLQESLKTINALIADHYKTGQREQIARLYLLDAHIYADGLYDTNRAQAIWEQIERDFPGTLAAKGAHLSLLKLAPEGLEIGQRFPAFNEGGISTAARMGHVTLIDFWATWCGPCKEEMPNVVAAYDTYHRQGFEIIGVSLDQDQNDLAKYVQSNRMGWPQYFDGLLWQNRLAVRYRIEGIPANYLLDRHGIIIGKNLRGPRLGEALAQAMTRS